MFSCQPLKHYHSAPLLYLFTLLIAQLIFISSTDVQPEHSEPQRWKGTARFRFGIRTKDDSDMLILKSKHGGGISMTRLGNKRVEADSVSEA
ncbi:hypothetical protein L218DRAFT_955296 [Marasmius fiardii PR-910]|nr:hypothetical protein L218DRAFT_955296 [Marasmius fiardii PR-910]